MYINEFEVKLEKREGEMRSCDDNLVLDDYDA